MCEEPEDGDLLIHVPHYHALIVGSTDESLPVFGDGQLPDPTLVTAEGLLAVTSIDLPESDGLVSGAGEDHISLGVEIDIGDVVVMAVKGLEAQVIVIDIPQLDGQVGGA
jgi:hypothetical protein